MDRRLCRPGELRLAQIITVCALVCLAEHQVASAGPTPDPIKRTPTRFELKFQSELDNSTVIKHPLQQQVFKCQVRLAPLSQAAPPSNQARRLRTFSSWLTKEGVDQKFRKVVQDVQNEQLARMLSLPPLEAGKQLPHKQLVNVTHFSIDWLKDGQSIWNAFEGNPIAIVNVTLKTPRNPSKSGARPRIEVKNTLNGQQMKLTSRLRLGQLRQSDSGQYKCLARVSFLMRPLEPLSDGLEHGLTEYIEQSLESSGAHLLVAPLMISNSTIGNEGVASNLERPASSPQSNSSEADQPSKDGYDRDVTRRKAAAQTDDTQDAEDALAPAQLSDGVGGRSTAGTHSNPLFEDDEDLFRLDLGELISGQQPQQAGADNISSRRDWQMAAKGSGANSSDTMDSNADDLLVNSQSEERQHEAYLDWILDNGDSSGSRWAEVEGGTGAGSRSSARGRAELESLSPSSGAQQQSASGAGDKKIDDRAETSLPGASVSNSSGASEAAGGDHQRAWEDKPRGLAEASPGSRQRAAPFDHRHASSSSYADQLDSFSDSAASRSAHRSKLARFVHRIVPEPSCYTGLGEHYRGNVSISSDQRACLNWLQVRAALSQPAKTRLSSNQNRSFSPAASGQRAASALAQARDEDHNHCRNPNGDHRGPWCFVAYSEELDGPLVMQPYLSASGRQWKSATSRQRSVRVGPESGRLFVVAHCQLASCSEYLWLYVVAPPLGLLVVFICLISLTIRSIRKSHYNAIFSAAYQRHSDSSAKSSSGLLCRFAQTRKRESHVLPQKASRACGLFSSLTRKLAPSSPKKGKLAQRDKYFNEDLFEVVDDIDWSDNGPTSQSMSPSESFRLHSTATTCEEGCSFKSPISAANRQANNWQQRSTLTHSMSTNPMLPKHNQMAALDLPMNEAQRNKPTTSSGSNGGHAGRMSKSKSQAGPLFATLRCHVRHAQHQQKMQQRRPQDVNGADSQSLAKKSSSFIENCQASLIKQSATSSKLQEAATSNDNSLASTTKTDLLLSCGSSTSDEGNGSAPSSNDKSYSIERCPLAKELARLDASSVTLAYDTQPIYEGKFSQVQTAYIKQRNDDLAQATGRIGAQVAVCSLKEHAAINESIFYAENLRVHHFNHLNILKLLGYVQPETGSDAYEGSSIVKSSKCLLIYDMAHLIDLNDWLKEQSKDAFEAQNDCELSLRQNLSCIAKQIALAIDYLHDKNIIYKDLACRNCFLDVTRMLVKLASFNIEPVIDARDGTSSGFDNSDYYRDSGDNGSISKKLSIKSMVRPKYLLDYYVIDSRPAECQLLPLSWISLESILFNKFNKQTDIWSFGCLLYELFSLGEVAYFGYSSKQVIDSVRSNLMPPQPLLCPNGIYKLMCKCLSDIPTLRPNIKHVYEQLNLYSGQCSSFLNHHLCII